MNPTQTLWEFHLLLDKWDMTIALVMWHRRMQWSLSSLSELVSILDLINSRNNNWRGLNRSLLWGGGRILLTPFVPHRHHFYIPHKPTNLASIIKNVVHPPLLEASQVTEDVVSLLWHRLLCEDLDSHVLVRLTKSQNEKSAITNVSYNKTKKMYIFTLWCVMQQIGHLRTIFNI